MNLNRHFKKVLQLSRPAESGGILIQVIAFMTIGMIILSGFIGWGTMSVRAARHSEYRAQAIQIAEAGIDYYRWHLAHAASDYQDGTATSGPYVHDYYDKQGNKLGTFTLNITAPALGSTLVTIKSTGKVVTDSSIGRTIQAKLAKPSFAKYAVVSNSDMSIGANIIGPLHSNGGILFVSGAAQNLVTSAKVTFNSTTTGFTNQWGVYTSGDPVPNTAFTSVTPVFIAGRQVGVPAVDFSGITADLAQLKADAQTSGVYYGPSAGGIGYHIVLKTTNKFDIYNVTANAAATCTSYAWWGANACTAVPNTTWSIGTQALIAANVSFPANGVIFASDNIWVDGQINGARITIVAAVLPDVGNRKNIIVNDNLLYTDELNGNDVIGLIAQDSFLIGLNSQDTQRVDAAIIAQNGRVSRYDYQGCGNGLRTNLTLYGMFASNQRYAYGNLDAYCGPHTASGYNTSRTYIYDSNLLYGPPPSFPPTTSQYQIVSWDEVAS